MHLLQALTALLLTGSSLCAATRTPHKGPHGAIAPKVFIVSMFAPEAEAWWNIPKFDLLAHNITIPGLSPLFPDVHCTEDYEVCQLITGEGEINAAATVTSVAFSPSTTASATFARYAVQVALQYEIDVRELPSNYSTGYIAQGTDFPGQYPTSIYGTEVFEVNADLRTIAANFARKANLSDSATAQAYRSRYNTPSGKYKAATLPPSVVECDVATTDVYFSGHILGSTFENTTKVLTNGTGDYCATAQEDNATFEVLLRSSIHKLTDFSRIIVMRTASDFDRPYPGASATYNLFQSSEQGAFEPAIKNLYVAGIKVVEGILDGWDETFAAGVKANNYIGDIFGSLGGVPDFGPGRKQALIGGGAYKRNVQNQFKRRV
ncbi:Purine nucleoside permease [Penicillium cf. griseofulvum]|nr:Purine nucleoside permease [Penicillium cf. griseofulvum]